MKQGRKGEVMKTLFENYCMYLPNTGHCMLRENRPFTHCALIVAL